MAEKILFDLEKFRSANLRGDKNSLPEAFIKPLNETHGLKSILELAVFQFTCRKCLDAPCVEVCPADALEKDEQGMIKRAVNLCISCKSCVVICPFGTMMTAFFAYHRDKEKSYDVLDREELSQFIRNSPEGAVQLVDMEEDPKQHIYKLTDRILVKEQMWKNNTL